MLWNRRRMLRSLAIAPVVAAWPGLARAEERGRSVLAADYGAKRLGMISPEGQLVWEFPIQDLHDLWVLDNGHILCQRHFGEVVELDQERKVVWEYNARKSNGNEGKRVEVHAFQRLAEGLTMVVESGPGRIIEVDRAGKIVREVKLSVKQPDPHRDTRLARKLASGNYLVCHEKDQAVREYDGAGKVVWQYDVGSPVYSAERLESGHTLVGTGGGHSVVEVDAAGQEVWRVGENDIAGVKLVWVTLVERLANGNTRIVNCHAGPENPQIVEITPQKELVWSFKDFKNFGNSLPMARVV
jgi:hypothetical protein